MKLDKSKVHINYSFIPSIIWVGLCLIYLLVRGLRGEHLIVFWINSYLNDFLCLPIILPPILFILRKWIIKNAEYTLSAFHIMFTWLYISIVFEWILPKYSRHFTSDIWDVFYYGLGAIAYYTWLKGFSKFFR
jgi:hypothetical protein